MEIWTETHRENAIDDNRGRDWIDLCEIQVITGIMCNHQELGKGMEQMIPLRGLERYQPSCQHLDLKFLIFRSIRKIFCLFWNTRLAILCYSMFKKLMHFQTIFLRSYTSQLVITLEMYDNFSLHPQQHLALPLFSF